MKRNRWAYAGLALLGLVALVLFLVIMVVSVLQFQLLRIGGSRQ